MNQIIIIESATAVPTVSLSYVASNGNAADQNSYTFSGQSVGAAATGRRLIIGVKTQAADVTAVTFGGVSMTRLTTAVGGPRFISFWEIADAVSTSGTFVFTCTGASNIRFSIWNVFGGTAMTIRDQQTASSSVAAVSVTLTCPDNSGVLAVSAHSSDTTATSIAWTGATERDDTNPEPTAQQRYGAADTTIASATSLGLTSTLTGTGGLTARILGICL